MEILKQLVAWELPCLSSLGMEQSPPQWVCIHIWIMHNYQMPRLPVNDFIMFVTGKDTLTAQSFQIFWVRDG